mgnify:CR=1 FL=1
MLALSILLLVAAPGAPGDAASALARGRELAQDGRWAEAVEILGPHVDADAAPADALVLLTRAVLEDGDLRRARLLAERGLLRFPEDLRFRRLDLAVLVERRDFGEAAGAARAVLARAPADRIAWRQLAAAALASDDEARQRAALEAAWLVDPDDDALFERHLRAQLAADHLETARALAADALERPLPDPPERLVGLAARAAEAAGDPELARRWLARIPADDRSRTLTLLEARIALASDDDRAAEAALARLVDRGEADPAVLVRAGRLAEARGALGRAEALYRRAARGEGDSARLAVLMRARLLAKRGARSSAETLLRTYLAEHPDDRYARQLLRVLRPGPR